MSTFTPPNTSNGVPPILTRGDPNQSPLAERLFRYYRARPEGINVYYRESNGVGSVTEADPVTTYDSNGNVLIMAGDDVKHVWYGGHAAETVTTAQATALTAAGYTVDP